MRELESTEWKDTPYIQGKLTQHGQPCEISQYGYWTSDIQNFLDSLVKKINLLIKEDILAASYQIISQYERTLTKSLRRISLTQGFRCQLEKKEKMSFKCKKFKNNIPWTLLEESSQKQTLVHRDNWNNYSKRTGYEHFICLG